MRKDRCWVSLLVGLALLFSVGSAGAALVVNSPTEGQAVHKTLAVEFTCDRSDGYVNISVDGQLLATLACRPEAMRFQGDVSGLADGQRSLLLEEYAPGGKLISSVTLKVQVQNKPPAEILQRGVSLFNRPLQGTYQVAVAGLTQIDAKSRDSLPEVLKTLEGLALRAEIRETLAAPSADGLQSAVRHVQSGFVQRFSPEQEEMVNTPLQDAGLSVAFLVGQEGLPRLSGAQPFVLGLPTLTLPAVQATLGYSWSAPMLTVLDLSSRQLAMVQATHKLARFEWLNDQPCAVIESTWQRQGPLTVVLWDRPFTFTQVSSSGTRTSYFAYERGLFLSANEEARHKVTASAQETRDLRAILLSSKVKQVTEATFAEEVLQSPVPVLMAFTRETCPLSQAAAPVFTQVAEEYGGRAKVVTVDTDTNLNLAYAYPGDLLPVVWAFSNQQAYKISDGFDEQRPWLWRQALNQLLGVPTAPAGPTAPVVTRPAPVAQPPVAGPTPAPSPGVPRRGRGGARKEEARAPLAPDLLPAGGAPLPYLVVELPREGQLGLAVFQGSRKGGRTRTQGASPTAPATGAAAAPTYPTAPTPATAPAYAPAAAYPGAAAPGQPQQPVVATVQELNDANFYPAVAGARVPVLIYLYSQMRPDPQLDQVLDETAAAYAGALGVGRVSMEANPQTARQYAPDGQSSLLVFTGGQALLRLPASAALVQQGIDELLRRGLLTPMVPTAQIRPIEFTYVVQTLSQVL